MLLISNLPASSRQRKSQSGLSLPLQSASNTSKLPVRLTLITTDRPRRESPTHSSPSNVDFVPLRARR
jgi:hypothetical protein